MAKTIPMIITNSDILVKDRDTDDFKTFSPVSYTHLTLPTICSV